MRRAFGLSLGALWTLPNTLIGLVAGLAGMVRGARPHWRAVDHALVFQRWPWGPGGAITFGNVILHSGESLDAACTTYSHRAGLCVDAAKASSWSSGLRASMWLVFWVRAKDRDG